MADFKYEIVEHIGTLSESAKGWTKELNKISSDSYHRSCHYLFTPIINR